MLVKSKRLIFVLIAIVVIISMLSACTLQVQTTTETKTTTTTETIIGPGYKPTTTGLTPTSTKVAEVSSIELAYVGILDTNISPNVDPEDKLTATAKVSFQKGGSIKAEWKIDGVSVKVVDLALPDGQKASETNLVLPTSNEGSHKVQFVLIEPKAITSNSLVYTVNPKGLATKELREAVNSMDFVSKKELDAYDQNLKDAFSAAIMQSHIPPGVRQGIIDSFYKLPLLEKMNILEQDDMKYDNFRKWPNPSGLSLSINFILNRIMNNPCVFNPRQCPPPQQPPTLTKVEPSRNMGVDSVVMVPYALAGSFIYVLEDPANPKFTSDSKIVIGGKEIETIFDDLGILKGTVPIGLFREMGDYDLWVRNPVNGLESNKIPVTYFGRAYTLTLQQGHCFNESQFDGVTPSDEVYAIAMLYSGPFYWTVRSAEAGDVDSDEPISFQNRWIFGTYGNYAIPTQEGIDLTVALFESDDGIAGATEKVESSVRDAIDGVTVAVTGGKIQVLSKVTGSGGWTPDQVFALISDLVNDDDDDFIYYSSLIRNPDILHIHLTHDDLESIAKSGGTMTREYYGAVFQGSYELTFRLAWIVP